MDQQTIGFGGVLLTICSVFLLFLCIIAGITGSLWVSKVANEDLQDTYNIVLYSVGSSPANVKNYILSNGGLSAQQIDMAFANTPAIVFKNVIPSRANKIIEDLRNMGSVVDAV